MKTDLQKRLQSAERRLSNAMRGFRAGKVTRAALDAIRAEYNGIGQALLKAQSQDDAIRAYGARFKSAEPGTEQIDAMVMRDEMRVEYPR